MDVLEVHGFEPRLTDSDLDLNNCPFHALAQEHPDLVCGMNLKSDRGFFGGSGADGGACPPRPGTLALLRPYADLRPRVIGSSPHYLLGSRARSGRPDWAGVRVSRARRATTC
jgi:hypothetical protein